MTEVKRGGVRAPPVIVDERPGPSAHDLPDLFEERLRETGFDPARLVQATELLVRQLQRQAAQEHRHAGAITPLE